MHDESHQNLFNPITKSTEWNSQKVFEYEIMSVISEQSGFWNDEKDGKTSWSIVRKRRNDFGKLFRLHSSAPIELLTKLVIDSLHYHITMCTINPIKANAEATAKATAKRNRYHEWDEQEH